MSFDCKPRSPLTRIHPSRCSDKHRRDGLNVATVSADSVTRRDDGQYWFDGTLLAPTTHMTIFVYTCDRCEDCFAGDSYRVKSENDGERLLDMVVCYGCYIEASQLGLDTETIDISRVALH